LRALATLGKAGGGVAFNLPNRSSGIEKIADAVTDAMNSLCRDKNGLYYDGLNATNPNIHSSWHAQIFPAAFGVAPEESWPQILTFLKKKGMAGSVYGSYWALKAAYAMDSDHGELALQLLTATAQTVNSWAHMIEVGATATMEAWSREEKPNLSWSHPWATSPLSAVVFGIFGIEPLLPAFQTFRCKPQPGSLTSASITVPTIKGAIVASFNVTVNVSTVFTLHISPPPNTMATVCLPKLNQSGNELLLDGKLVDGYSLRDYICIDNIGSSYTSREIIRKEFKR
jgi:alpha-L-rhamnosidase